MQVTVTVIKVIKYVYLAFFIYLSFSIDLGRNINSISCKMEILYGMKSLCGSGITFLVSPLTPFRLLEQTSSNNYYGTNDYKQHWYSYPMVRVEYFFFFYSIGQKIVRIRLSKCLTTCVLLLLTGYFLIKRKGVF